MVANGGRNEADLIRLAAPGSGLRENIARRHDTRRPVVVTRPTEPATLRTPTRDFHQESIAHLGFRGEDGRRRREHFIAAKLIDDIELLLFDRAPQRSFLRILCGDRAAHACRYAFFSRRVSVYRAIVVVADKIKRRNIEATALSRERQQQIFFAAMDTDASG